MNGFIKRNEVRKRQIEFARTSWVRQVGDRIQLSADYQQHVAWSSGTIIKLYPGRLGVSLPAVRTIFKMDDGTEYVEVQEMGSSGGWIAFAPLVPHEDYFKDEPAASTEVGLVE